MIEEFVELLEAAALGLRKEEVYKMRKSGFSDAMCAWITHR